MKRMFILAGWLQGAGLSGSDRIFIELSRRWQRRINITLIVAQDGWRICQREGLGDFKHTICASDRFNSSGYFVNYLYRSWCSIINSLKMKLKKGDIVYSSSDFLPDSLPALILKLRNKDIKWLAGFYLFCPRPWLKETPYRGKRRLIGLFYWFTQRPVYWIIKRFADMVFVTSSPDVAAFITRKRGPDNIAVIQGGVDLSPAKQFLSKAQTMPIEKRKYDACFIGRFHYQKGVLECIDIWRLVCNKRSGARLAMIGIGPLEYEVKRRIVKNRLNQEIDLMGYRDGDEKYEIFKNSKIVLHPATYDSGGMASIEAMAWGLPGVSFDLEALRSYYPKGMLKTKCFNLVQFAENILSLLTDTRLYAQLSKDAISSSLDWDWDKRADELYCLMEAHA